MESVGEKVARLKKERNAVVLAHNYCLPEVQDLADIVGDSLGLSVAASKTEAEAIVFCGVTFMAETAKILNPEKTVLIPEPDAVCPMAQMCTPEQIRSARAANPGATVVGYVNSTAACKAEMDVCCTSSNAVKVVGNSGKDVVFVPDRNLGAYAASQCPDKNLVLWHGFCPIHQSVTVGQVEKLSEKYPGEPVIAHPECRSEVLEKAVFVGSTEGMIKFCRESPSEGFVVITEEGMLHRLKKEIPGKKFRFPESAVCGAMKMTSPESVVRCLENLSPEIGVPAETAEKARIPVERMIRNT